MEIEWNKDRENVFWGEDNAVCMINAVLLRDAKGNIFKTNEVPRRCVNSGFPDAAFWVISD